MCPQTLANPGSQSVPRTDVQTKKKRIVGRDEKTLPELWPASCWRVVCLGKMFS